MHGMTRVVVFAFALLFALSLDVFAFDTGLIPLPPVVLIGAFAAFAALFVGRLPHVFASPLWRVCVAFSMLAMIGFLGHGQDASAWQSVRDAWLAVIFVTVWSLVLADAAHRRAALAAVGVALAVAFALNVYELSHPLQWSAVHGRSAGTFINPNLSALGILAAVVALSASRIGNRACGVALVVAGAAILPTFSRGGIALWFALCFVLLLFSGRFRTRQGVTILAVAAGALVAAFLLLPEEILEVPNVAQRLDVLRGEGFADASSAWRHELVEEGVRLLQERPLLGHGPAKAAYIDLGTSSQGAHNDHLALGINYGLLGLIVWFGYLAHLSRRARLSMLILVGGAALFFHSLLLNRQVLLALVLAESEEAS